MTSNLKKLKGSADLPYIFEEWKQWKRSIYFYSFIDPNECTLQDSMRKMTNFDHKTV